MPINTRSIITRHAHKSGGAETAGHASKRTNWRRAIASLLAWRAALTIDFVRLRVAFLCHRLHINDGAFAACDALANWPQANMTDNALARADATGTVGQLGTHGSGCDAGRLACRAAFDEFFVCRTVGNCGKCAISVEQQLDCRIGHVEHGGGHSAMHFFRSLKAEQTFGRVCGSYAP